MDKREEPGTADSIDRQLRHAMSLDKAGHTARAVEIYENILQQAPGHPYAQYFLALAAVRKGDSARAVSLLRTATATHQDEPAFHELLGQALQAEGEMDEALAAFEQVLSTGPRNAKVNFHKGQVLRGLGRRQEAIEAFRIAVDGAPEKTIAWFQLAETYLAQGLPEEAIACLEQLLALHPDLPEACVRLGLARKAAGDYDAAMSLYERAHVLDPDLETAYVCQAEIYLAQEQLDKAQATYHALYERVRGKPADTMSPAHGGNNRSPLLTRFLLENLADHVEYLVEKEKIDTSHLAMARECRSILDETTRPDNDRELIALTPEQSARLSGLHYRAIHYEDTPPMDGRVIGADLDTVEIQDRYLDAELPMVLIDDFLRPEALRALNDFCLESTIFFNSSANMYLFSQAYEGFNCTLLYDMARELKARFPRVLGTRELTNMWVYRHPAKGDGVRAHTDHAAVTFNFWITPDEANLDKEHGGLVIYDRLQPEDWDWYRINTLKDTRAVREQIGSYLEQANTTTIPYRENRAMMFHSSLFHASDSFHFRDDYTSRRMNVSMLFS